MRAEALDALLYAPAGPVVQDVWKRGHRVAALAKRLCPVDEGTLRASIYVEVIVGPGGVVCRVGSRLRYAIFVHEGTGLYGPRHAMIRPVHARMLAWPVRGTSSSRPSSVPGRGRVTSKSLTPTGWAFARQVRGVRPRRFLSEALPAAA